MLSWFRRRGAWRPMSDGDGTSRAGARRQNVLFTLYVVVVVVGFFWAIVASNP